MKEVLDLLEQAKLMAGNTIETTDQGISYCDEHYTMNIDDSQVVTFAPCEPAAVTLTTLE
jgi:hypothetical protein